MRQMAVVAMVALLGTCSLAQAGDPWQSRQEPPSRSPAMRRDTPAKGASGRLTRTGTGPSAARSAMAIPRTTATPPRVTPTATLGGKSARGANAQLAPVGSGRAAQAATADGASARPALAPVVPFCVPKRTDMTGTGRKVGATTYYSFRNSHGDNVSGNSRTVGGTTYYSFRDQNGRHVSGTSRTVGGATYYSCHGR